jgi:hypothetical protein
MKREDSLSAWPRGLESAYKEWSDGLPVGLKYTATDVTIRIPRVAENYNVFISKKQLLRPAVAKNTVVHCLHGWPGVVTHSSSLSLYDYLIR